MKTVINQKSLSRVWGFTLIELMVVIGVIAMLAAMLLVVSPGIKFKSRISAVKGQLMQIQAAMESYHAKYNTYPPDAYKTGSPNNNAAITPLYYELVGTTNFISPGSSSSVYNDYVSEPGGGVVPINTKSVVQFNGLGGLLNSSQDGLKPQNFIGKVPKVVNFNGVKLLAVDSELPPANELIKLIPFADYNALNTLNNAGAVPNVWMYSVSNPAHNKTSYDLWAWVIYGDRKQLIANWKN